MVRKTKKIKFPSELRFDLTSKDWVVIATGRAKRPKAFRKEKRIEIKIPKSKCPFCRIKTQKNPVLIYSKGKKIPLERGVPKNWTTVVIPNRFPAFLPQPKWNKKIEGNLYQTMNAVGFCELVVTGDHEKSLALLPTENIKEVIDSYKERYLALMKKPFVNYVSIFHNHGVEAGATQPHPHSQIITSPLFDIDLRKALTNSQKHFEKNKKCANCQMNNWERRAKKRIVFENRDFLAVCPFASKAAFEIIISPKKHLPNFEKITEEEEWQLAEVFKVVLGKLYKALNNPSYNFYLKTAPCDGGDYQFYHWHFTILPKTGIWAGFELGARMEISSIAPENAAAYLKKIR
jgi:UDPglucose--hexose-1-phosphate uridylyltransferase